MIHDLLYIEPGSSSYIIQMIVAGLLGAAFWIKMSWQRLKAFFMGRKYKAKDKEEKKS